MSTEKMNENILPEEEKTEVKGSKIKETGSKVKTFVQKNWKKAAAGAAIVGGTVLGYALGHKNGEDEALQWVTKSDDNVIEMHSVDEESNEN